jgi:hypothetical protein
MCTVTFPSRLSWVAFVVSVVSLLSLVCSLPAQAASTIQVSATHSLPAHFRLKNASLHPQTMLDEAGEYHSGAMPVQVGLWRDELHRLVSPSSIPQQDSPAAIRAAQLHVWLGEFALGHDEQPEEAIWHFRQAAHLCTPYNPIYGLAKYDFAITLYYRGAYEDAEDAFHALLRTKGLRGVNFRACALWYRHAATCQGYHAERSEAGIPEPTQLDPRCGAAALAACLRSLSLPYDERTVLKSCHVTGLGSSSQDIVNAARKLGVVAHAVVANDQGLIALPKPMVAYVEHDHFVALTRADRNGVSYLCSDCGPWPGGEVDLTWPQWNMLTTGLFITVTKPGSAWDRTLSEALTAPTSSHVGVQIASAGSLRGLGLSRLAPLMQAMAQVRQNVTLYGSVQVVCGGRPNSLHPPHYIHCSCDKNGSGKTTGKKKGPADKDPVDLGTGEEEYTPDADLSVYNPTGPSVAWQRIYDSLRPCGGSNFLYENDDFG